MPWWERCPKRSEQAAIAPFLPRDNAAGERAHGSGDRGRSTPRCQQENEGIPQREKAIPDDAPNARVETICDRILEEGEVTRRQAALIARDQVLSLNGQVTQAQHEAAGITQYVWRTSGDGDMRPAHRALDGKTFRYDDPPVVDVKKGRREHPGGDWGCRCTAAPLIPGYDDSAAVAVRSDARSDWSEREHPRAKDGEFTKGAAGSRPTQAKPRAGRGKGPAETSPAPPAVRATATSPKSAGLTPEQLAATHAHVVSVATQVGVPRERHGFDGFEPGEKTGEIFNPNPLSVGRNVAGRGLQIDAAIHDDIPGWDDWNHAPLHVRIEAVMAHEHHEMTSSLPLDQRHAAALREAIHTSLRISDEARNLLRSYLKFSLGEEPDR